MIDPSSSTAGVTCGDVGLVGTREVERARRTLWQRPRASTTSLTREDMSRRPRVARATPVGILAVRPCVPVLVPSVQRA